MSTTSRGWSVNGSSCEQPSKISLRLFAPRNHLDRIPERVLRLEQEGIDVARLPQRLRADRADLLGAHAAQAFVHAGERVDGDRDRLLAEPPLAVEPGGEADRLLPVADAGDVAAFDAPDLETEAVGAEIDGGELHGCGGEATRERGEPGSDARVYQRHPPLRGPALLQVSGERTARHARACATADAPTVDQPRNSSTRPPSKASAATSASRGGRLAGSCKPIAPATAAGTCAAGWPPTSICRSAGRISTASMCWSSGMARRSSGR